MYQKMVLLHEFDNNVAVTVAVTTVASITAGISSFRQNNVRRGLWFKLGFGLRNGGASAVPAPAAAVGVAPAPAAAVAGVLQLPSHR